MSQNSTPQTADTKPDKKTESAPRIVGIQIMVPVTVFPGLPAGHVIHDPTPEQIELAQSVRSSVHFVTSS